MAKGKTNTSIRKIENIILKIAIEIAKKGDGALFVIGNNLEYTKLLKQKFEPFSVFESGSIKLLKNIATIDGAVIISKDGLVKDYGAMIKGARPFVGYGTRHAAAMTASKNNNVSILCSEEERKVKVFKNGKYILQIDSLERNVEKNVDKITSFLETIGAGFIGTLGAGTLAPALGIALLPGIVIFGSSYYIIKKLMNKMQRK